MNDPSAPQPAAAHLPPAAEFSELSRGQMHSALLAQMVMQQSNLALMLMGKTPHPETGQTMRDLEAAKLFIDQLEMLEVKTKGNLNPHETALLRQSLMTLRLAFVEAVNAPEAPAKAKSPAFAEDKTAPVETTSAASEADSGKRFSKKYSA